MHDEAGIWEVDGQGAGMLSFKSQRKLTSEDSSNVASDGKLGKRHPDSISYIDNVKLNTIKQVRQNYRRAQ